MAKKPSPKPTISARKSPRQARSEQLVADILEAALRVLLRDGGARFTTVRVAEEAGVSVGSLYQYFPNKASLLFRLQTDEWRETGGIMEEILMDPTRPPLERLRRAVRMFLHSEREEAELRAALRACGVDAERGGFRDVEADAHRSRVSRRTLAFFEIALPRLSAPERARAAEVVMTSLSAVGEHITEQGRSRAEIDTWAGSLSEMYCAYLERLAGREPTR